MMDIKITKLPKKLDLDALIVQRVTETYRRCPFCYETVYNNLINAGYSPQEADDIAFDKKIRATVEWSKNKNNYRIYKPLSKGSRKKYYWKHISFHCCNCGMSWDSPDYPDGLCKDPETCKEIFTAYQKAKELDISRFLLPCLKEAKII